MTTPEQQAREMLERMGIQSAYQRMSAGELVELANLIAEHDALKAELAAIKGAGEPYCYVYEWDTEFGLIQNTRPANFNGRQFDRVVPLYTRPTTPLTEADIDAIFEGVPGDPPHRGYRYRVARALEAHIKGAKP